MRFHLIDRVLRLEPQTYVLARKVTSHREEYWEDFGRGPEMPPPLVLESLCQAGTWMVLLSTESARRAVLLSTESVSFGGPIRPGDVLTVEGRAESFSDEVAVLSGTVTVNGDVVLEARSIMCALVAAEELAAPDDTARLRGQLLEAGVGR